MTSIPRYASVVFWAVLLSASAIRSPADMVTDWNNILIDTIRADTTQPGPTYGSRNMAMVHVAIYDAINAIERTHQPFHASPPADPGASREAAAAQAAWRVLVGLYPLQETALTAALQLSLESIPDGPAKDAGIQIGETVGLAILDLRANDHAYEITPYTPGDQPGDWRPEPPIENVGALGPGWGEVTPLVLPEMDSMMPPAPPGMSSAEYAASFNDVKDLGAVDSATRTEDQRQIGIYWGYDRGGMGPPPILYSQITQVIAADQGNTLAENARLFALINLAQADAGILCWRCKYLFNIWRPITAIQHADEDGNPLTEADADWQPLGAPGGGVVPDFTPPFPAYTSGHATFGAAVFRSIANFYGTDEIAFTAESEELPGQPRSFERLSQATEENGRSRIYLGIHYEFDNQLGQASGTQVADFIFANSLRPLRNAARAGWQLYP